MNARILIFCAAALFVVTGCQNSSFSTGSKSRSLFGSKQPVGREPVASPNWNATNNMVAAQYEDGQTVTQSAPLPGQQNAAPNTNSIAEILSRAHAASAAGQVQQAKADYELVVQQQPKHSVAHHRLAVIADTQGNFAVAERHYRLALIHAPQTPKVQGELYSDLGYSYLLQKRYRESENHLLKSLQFDPTYSTALNNLGLLYGKQGDYNRALEMFRRSGAREEDVQRNIQTLFPSGPPAGSQINTGNLAAGSAAGSREPFANLPPNSNSRANPRLTPSSATTPHGLAAPQPLQTPTTRLGSGAVPPGNGPRQNVAGGQAPPFAAPTAIGGGAPALGANGSTASLPRRDVLGAPQQTSQPNIGTPRSRPLPSRTSSPGAYPQPLQVPTTNVNNPQAPQLRSPYNAAGTVQPALPTAGGAADVSGFRQSAPAAVPQTSYPGSPPVGTQPLGVHAPYQQGFGPSPATQPTIPVTRAATPLQRTGFTTARTASQPSTAPQQPLGRTGNNPLSIPRGTASAQTRAMAAGLATGGLFPMSPQSAPSVPNAAPATGIEQYNTGIGAPSATGFPQDPLARRTPTANINNPLPSRQNVSGFAGSSQPLPGQTGSVPQAPQFESRGSGSNNAAYNDSLRDFQEEIRRQNSGLGSTFPSTGVSNPASGRPVQAQYPPAQTGVRTP